MQKFVNSLIKATDSFLELIVIYVFIIATAAGFFSYFEDRSWWDSVYFSVVTALTIGYGDICPITTGGRIVAGALMHALPLFIIPLITARLSSKLIVNSDVFDHNEQENIKQSLANIEKHLNIKD